MTNVQNPFTHQHDHDDESPAPEVFDPAQESLADALRVSFWILKVLMVIVVLVYAFSGWFNVDQQHVAVRLRFGKIVGETHQTQVIQPGGPHLAFPYPFEQVIQVPTAPAILRLDEAFWWQVQQGIDADQPKATPLNPAFDGSLLTADANIMHARWSLTFQIRRDTTGGIDPEAVIDFVQNVGSNEAAERIVRAAAEQAVVLTAAVTKADDLMKSSFDKAAASERIRNSLKSLRTGLHVSQLSITRPTMPGPVRGVYQLVTQAAAAKSKRIDEARKQRDQILKDAAGDAHGPLWELVQAYEQAHLGHTDEDRAAADAILAGIHNALRRKRIDPEDMPGGLMLEAPVRIDGEAASVISQALAYRTDVVNTARREADEFQALKPLFDKSPMVFKTDRLASTLEAILTSQTVKTHYLPSDVAIYIEDGPDPQIEEKDEKRRLEAEQPQP